MQGDESDYDINFTDDEDNAGDGRVAPNLIPRERAELLLKTEVDRELIVQGKLKPPYRAILDPLSLNYHLMAVLNDGGGDGFPNCEEGRLLMLDREVRMPGTTPSLHIEVDGCIGEQSRVRKE